MSKRNRPKNTVATVLSTLIINTDN